MTMRVPQSGADVDGRTWDRTCDLPYRSGDRARARADLETMDPVAIRTPGR
jgi:hypothetical protein